MISLRRFTNKGECHGTIESMIDQIVKHTRHRDYHKERGHNLKALKHALIVCQLCYYIHQLTGRLI